MIIYDIVHHYEGDLCNSYYTCILVNLYKSYWHYIAMQWLLMILFLIIRTDK